MAVRCTADPAPAINPPLIIWWPLAGSIVCAYQPIVDLASGAATGCEVLARWRDIDDQIVYPDRFDLVLEITESDEILPTAQREIERLRRLGIKTYIDDFGSGYSNMHNLAALSVDGVKLDRAFAMAPDNSLMAQMLHHAVEMIHAAGRVMVIEGVETAERLSLLRRMQARIDYVQGYFISRPLDISGFASFLTPGQRRPEGTRAPSAAPSLPPDRGGRDGDNMFPAAAIAAK